MEEKEGWRRNRRKEEEGGGKAMANLSSVKLLRNWRKVGKGEKEGNYGGKERKGAGEWRKSRRANILRGKERSKVWQQSGRE